jgi:hypothetical protein
MKDNTYGEDREGIIEQKSLIKWKHYTQQHRMKRNTGDVTYVYNQFPSVLSRLMTGLCGSPVPLLSTSLLPIVIYSNASQNSFLDSPAGVPKSRVILKSEIGHNTPYTW